MESYHTFDIVLSLYFAMYGIIGKLTNNYNLLICPIHTVLLTLLIQKILNLSSHIENNRFLTISLTSSHRHLLTRLSGNSIGKK